MREPITAKMLEYREIAPEVRHFLFEAQNAGSFSFVPGQFVSFTTEIGGSDITRAYSMAAPPCGSGRFELCLNRVAGGKFSNYLFDMRPGDCVRMTGPWGSFIFRQPVRDSVLVAAGAGVVPFRAMLDDQLKKDTVREFKLLFGARYEHGLLFAREFEELSRRHSNFQFIPTLSRPNASWTGRTGHVQEYLFEIIGERRDINVFVCGLKAMVDDVRTILKANGFDRKQIFYEKYD